MNNSEDNSKDIVQLRALQYATRRAVNGMIALVCPIYEDVGLKSNEVDITIMLCDLAEFLMELYGRPILEMPSENLPHISTHYPFKVRYFKINTNIDKLEVSDIKPVTDKP